MRNIFLVPLKLIFGCNGVNLVSTAKDMAKVAWDLPRHNNFIYINQNSLDDEFFLEAKSTLGNGYVYIILSSTGSPAANLISTFTGKQYAHTSLSFDEELKTLISYNGGNGIADPGMNHEKIEFFHQKEDACYVIYKLKATKHQKEIILEEVRKINERGSSYNVLGLFLSYKMRANIMYCSQFVYSMLQSAGLAYFTVKPEKVHPIDFVDRDKQGKLEFCRKVFLKDVNEVK